MAVATVAVVPACASAMLPAAPGSHRLFEALLVAILSSALPYSLEMAAMRRLSLRTFGILMSLDPVAAALAGLLLLGEHLSLLSWVAILCIVLASIGSVATGEAGVRL
jgi:inner membrane transporter RhtA